MNERDIDKKLRSMKNHIPVNEELKQSLRQTFKQDRKRPKWLIRVSPLAAIVVLCVMLVFTSLQTTQNVSAASLKIENQVSFTDIGGGDSIGISEFDGTVFIPVAGKGIFAYSQNTFQSIYDRKANHVKVSADGKKLLYSENGSIGVYDLEIKKADELLTGNGADVYYEQPSWSPDGTSILYTKNIIEFRDTHGFEVKECGIYEMDLKTQESEKLADGYYSAYVHGKGSKKAIIFERDHKIIYKDLNDGTETEVDDGRFPSVSPRGNYIAYVKNQDIERELDKSKNAKVIESVDNVWIADVADFTVKKQVTSNFPFASVDEREWLEELEPSDIPQALSFSGLYSYYHPTWSSDEESLYVIKGSTAQGMKIMRIDFTSQEQQTVDTVKRFLQALIVGDEDYAKTLMKNPPVLLTTSNPHQVGYKITGSGQEDGREYVDAEVYWAYTANPYYQAVTTRYYLSPGGNGYIIDESVEKETVEVYAKENIVYINRGNVEQKLFGLSDISAEFEMADDARFSSLAYSKEGKMVVFALQASGVHNQEKIVKLLSYNIENNEFIKVGTISEIDQEKNIGISKLTVDPLGKFAALDLYVQMDSGWKSYVYVYNLRNGKNTNLETLITDTQIDSINTVYWDEGRLVFAVSSNGQIMNFEYEPDLN